MRACDEVLKDLDQLLADKLGDAYVGPGQLRSLLRNKVREIPEPPPEAPSVVEQPAAATSVAQPAPVVAAAPPPMATAAGADDVDRVVRGNQREHRRGRGDPARRRAVPPLGLPPAALGRMDEHRGPAAGG